MPRYKQRMKPLTHPSAEQDALPPPPIERSSNKLRAGFTLVEIAIVLVIIGLIVGGVMVGADLIKAATLRSQISQINRYSAATATFQMKYSLLPGDMPPSLAAQNGLGTRVYGDGNGVIEATPACCGWNIGVGELAYFWGDLTAANLSDQATIPTSTNPSETVPRGKIDGIHLAVWSSCSTAYGCLGPGTPGINYMALCTVSISNTCESGGLTVANAFAIDQKMDDGTPMNGAIQAFAPAKWTGNNPAWYPAGNLDSSSTCFNNSTNAYSTNVNGGAAMNCALSLRFR